MNLRKQSEKAKFAADEWNAKHAIGTHVKVRRVNGEVQDSQTRSEAWEMCGTAVVLLSGISGGYDLSRVSPVQ